MASWEAWLSRVQRAAKVVLHGQKRPPTAKVAFLITSEMREGLKALGYREARIRHMPPAEAGAILREGRRADAAASEESMEKRRKAQAVDTPEVIKL